MFTHRRVKGFTPTPDEIKRMKAALAANAEPDGPSLHSIQKRFRSHIDTIRKWVKERGEVHT